MNPHRLRLLILATLLTVACSPTRGCVESRFELARESRLPRWFDLSGAKREEVTISLEYWNAPWGGTPKVIVHDAQGRELASAVGVESGATGGYPSFNKITINGITELIEHRQMEPIFYISDDPELRRRFGVN